MDILENLNKEQIEAVKHIDGPLLVLAGAGSGKTKVLTTRIAYLISLGVSPDNILAITFTNKAAGEMKERISKLVGFSSKFMQISTFHSFGLKIVKENYEYLGYDKNFVIFDADDTLTIIKKILKDKNLDPDKFNPRAIRSQISKLKNDLIDSKKYSSFSLTEFEKVVLEVYKKYESELIKNNSLDFDDLLILPIKLFEKRKDLLLMYQERYKYILIDEYQDTNEAQYKLTKLLAGKYKNICCVGDADQAIYGFRGANYKNILNFESDYKNALVIKLEENYRSSKTILDAANSVIKNNKNRKSKNLYSNLGIGDKITYYRANSGLDEVKYVVNKIKELKDNLVSLSDIVVLYRTNAQSRVFEDGLMKAGIPYKIVGGLNFYSRMEIKNLLAYLRLICNSNDNVSLERIINVPRRGIGTKTISNLYDKSYLFNVSLYDAIDSGKELVFKNMIEELKSIKDTMSLVEFIDLVLDKSGLRKELVDEKTLEADIRLENLEEFKSVAKSFEDEMGVVSLDDFLLNVSLITDNNDLKEDNNAVSLMTIHAVKGLEFDYVFVVGLEEGLFPHQNSMFSEDELEEERRLCYVAITRCKKKLYLSNARMRLMYGSEQVYPISRFINEIDANLLENESKVVKYDEKNKKIDYNDSSEKIDVKSKYGDDEMNYKVGDLVYHEVFGMGTITNIILNEKDPKKTLLKIAFKLPYGIKTLIYSHKSLRKV
ncbi:MAG: UvrD-helicase domain-containing protein [Erysipelotrichaceae bacterium]|nr:UvrD-helicase domain-containing protein [Erysipelotrichaceae bacterium]